MELTDIRCFLEACSTLNFARAAENCGVSAPTLSRAIRKLEDELGGQLFRRERRLTHLTDLGRLMQAHFLTIQDAADAARRDADKYAAAETRLTIGVISTISSAFLISFLGSLGRKAPSLDLDIWESHCEDIETALEAGEIDIALMSLPEYPDSLRHVELYREPYDVAFAPSHRFADFSEVPLAELEGENYIKRFHCEFPSNFIRLEVAKPYKTVRVRYATEREDWIQSMVAAGLGVTLMPRYLPLLNGLDTRAVVDPVVERRICIVTRAGRRHSGPVLKALEAAKSASGTLGWSQDCKPSLSA